MGLSGSDGSDTAKHCWEDKSACKCVRVREFVRVGAAENDVVVGASVCFVCAPCGTTVVGISVRAILLQLCVLVCSLGLRGEGGWLPRWPSLTTGLAMRRLFGRRRSNKAKSKRLGGGMVGRRPLW